MVMDLIFGLADFFELFGFNKSKTAFKVANLMVMDLSLDPV